MVAPETLHQNGPASKGAQGLNLKDTQIKTGSFPDEMSFPKKEIPEWLKAASNNLPSSNFTVPRVVSTSGSKSNSKKEPHSTASDLKKDKNGVVIHVWDKIVRFEKQDNTFLLNTTWEHIAKSIESNEIPADLIPCLNDGNCKFFQGHLLVNLFDHRRLSEPNNNTADLEQPQGKTLLLKPTQKSILADVVYLASNSKEGLSSEAALRVESELLDLDLRVDESSIKVRFAMQNIEGSMAPVEVKCLKNSSEIEAEEAGKKEMKELMFTMNETRPKRQFSEALGGTSLIEELRKKRMHQAQSTETKKTKAKKASQDTAPAGFKMVRHLRFERDDEKGKVTTLLSFYEGPGGRFKGILRYGPTSATGETNTKEVDLESAATAESYATSFINSFTLENTLVMDTHAQKKAVPPENVPAPPKKVESVSVEPAIETPISSGSLQATPVNLEPPSLQSPSTHAGLMTPQPADIQALRNKHLMQQKIQQQSPVSTHNPTPPRPVAQTPMLLPQMTGLQYNALQMQMQMQMQQQNYQNMLNSQQNFRLQRPMMQPDLTPQQIQILAAQRKQQLEAIRQKQMMNPNPINLTIPQRQAIEALTSKQPLTPAHNQTLDALLQQPIPPQQRQFILNLRAQSIAANPASDQPAPQGSTEPSTPKAQNPITPQQPSTPQQQPPQTPRQQQQGLMGQPITASQIQQTFTPHQQQAFAALKQQGLNPQQQKILEVLKLRPAANPNQQALLKNLQDKQAHHNFQVQAFLAQALKNNKHMINIAQQLQQPNAMSPGSSLPSSQIQTSHLSPQEQQSIRFNQLQQQSMNAHVQAQLQAQMQTQMQAQMHRQQVIAQFQQHSLQQRPFIRPNVQQQQMIARLQQQQMLNPMSRLPPQQLMPLNMAQAMHPLRPGMPMSMPIRHDTNPAQSPLPPGKMSQDPQPPSAS